MEDKGTRPKPKKAEIAFFLAFPALAVGAHFFNPVAAIQQDWSVEMTDRILGLLPVYVATCLAIAFGLVILGLKKLPRQIPFITIAATIIALSGSLVYLKIHRDREVDQARIHEAELISNEILTLRGLGETEIEPAARGIMRRTAIRMYGEDVAGDMFLKPMSTLRKEAGL